MSATSSAYDVLRPLMDTLGVTVSAEEFHDAVNVAFHDFESECYDEVHRSMWESLPRQFDLLCDDVLEKGAPLPSELTMLDVGCGTGLASELFLRTKLGRTVRGVDLLDTSPRMLKAANTRAAAWRATHTSTLGTTDQVPSPSYDVILICSVLHHVPDLPAFFDRVARLQAKGGLFLHLQDPNGDYLGDRELVRRTKMCARTPRMLRERIVQRLSSTSVARRVQKFLAAHGRPTYIDRTNEALLHTGIIRKPMTKGEIWAVTDLHVDAGISVKKMKEQLKDYKPISTPSYSFFGRMWSELPKSLQREEVRLSDAGAANGMQISGAWQRT
jgi:2-polyprenyl-3-methyl-5-hydroxy-6-metoxy-1,4-benzoquinol methylase